MSAEINKENWFVRQPVTLEEYDEAIEQLNAWCTKEFVKPLDRQNRDLLTLRRRRLNRIVGRRVKVENGELPLYREVKDGDLPDFVKGEGEGVAQITEGKATATYTGFGMTAPRNGLFDGGART